MGEKRKKRSSPAKVTQSDILTYDEMDKFLLGVDDLETLMAIRTMLYGGLRVQEVVDLRVGDFDFTEGYIHILKGKGDKYRRSPCDIATLSMIRAYAIERRFSQDDKLFSTVKRTIQRHVEKIYEVTGIPRKRSPCHSLRHTCATWQLDQGIPLPKVKDNLGHEKIETTQIYLHFNIRQRVRTYRDIQRFQG